MLTLNDRFELQNKIIEKITYEIRLAFEHNTIDELLSKYNISLKNDKFYVDNRTHKILVLGAINGKLNDYYIASKQLGINNDQIEFISDYNELKRFNATILNNSTKYSDIIYGPNPHKQVNIGDFSSLLSLMKSDPDNYPKVIEAISNSKLKLTMTNFKDAIKNTRLYNSKIS